MRHWLIVLGAVSVGLVTGCGPRDDSGDDDDDDNQVEHLLEPGLYNEVTFNIDVNECDYLFEPDTDGMEVEEAPLRVNGLPVTREGNTFLGSQPVTINFQDCSLEVVLGYDGVIPSDNQFTVSVTMDTTYVSGDSCDQVVPTLPCTSGFTSHYQRAE